jgi:ABC-type nitrate/sulfonate/bicarbonate transport system substrate-binding protein
MHGVAVTVLDVGSFGGASTLPLRVAEEVGFFAARGLQVRRTVTTDSDRLREALRDAQLAIVHAAPDNVIAWSDAGVPVSAWLAGSSGPISLVARTAESVVSLRGSRIGVDSPLSGFAPILRKLLMAGGVGEDEVELVSLGATRFRFVALEEGAVDATMLTLPWSLLAERSGAVILGDHTDIAPGLLTSCAASLPAWLSENQSRAMAYADAIDTSVLWLRDPANGERASQLLATDMKLEVEVAAAVLALMLDAARGWPTGARLHGPELTPTWDLRAETMRPPALPPEAYVGVLPET